MKTTLRIVEVEGGKYAVQKRSGFSWAFCSLKEDYVWSIPSHIREYCLADSLTQAEQALEIICLEIAMKKDKPPRVLKVIRKVRV